MKINKLFKLFIAIILNSNSLNSQDIDDARQLIDNERYQSAASLLEQATSEVDSEPEASYLLVKTYLELDKDAVVKKYITNHILPAISSNANPIDRLTYARYLLNIGNKLGAGEIINSLLDERKIQKNSSLLVAMSEVYIEEEAGDARLALSWLDMAEKRDKNNPSIDILKGLAYRKLSDASNAFVAYQDALKKDPGNIKAHYLIGKIFTAQKNSDVYLEHFLSAYHLDSTFAPVLEELYKYYYYRNIKEAKRYLEIYIRHSDYSLQNDYYLTDILYLNGEYSNAIVSAKSILSNPENKGQPRLFKLIAYSYAKGGDSVQALQYLNDYFNKEDPAKVIAADFELRAQLTERNPGAVKEAIAYYSIASEMDTVLAEKAKYAAKISSLYKQEEDYSNQAIWLGKLYQWKEKSNNVDLFNWGLAHYTSKEYTETDTVFGIYTTRYPEDIYGYYWRAQANAAIDTGMTKALAIPYYNKVVEVGEKDKETNKKMLLKSYGYLGGYEANITKDYPASLGWFERYLELDKDNADVIRYVEMLRKWVIDKK